MARVSKHIRLMMYSYLPKEEVIKKISLLSKKERVNLRDSALFYKDRRGEDKLFSKGRKVETFRI